MPDHFWFDILKYASNKPGYIYEIAKNIPLLKQSCKLLFKKIFHYSMESYEVFIKMGGCDVHMVLACEDKYCPFHKNRITHNDAVDVFKISPSYIADNLGETKYPYYTSYPADLVISLGIMLYGGDEYAKMIDNGKPFDGIAQEKTSTSTFNFTFKRPKKLKKEPSPDNYYDVANNYFRIR